MRFILKNIVFTFIMLRGTQHRWTKKWITILQNYIFSKNIFFPPSTVKISSPPPFLHLLPLIFAFFLNKLSYFFSNQPITHIFTKWKTYTPALCCRPIIWSDYQYSLCSSLYYQDNNLCTSSLYYQDNNLCASIYYKDNNLCTSLYYQDNNLCSSLYYQDNNLCSSLYYQDNNLHTSLYYQDNNLCASLYYQDNNNVLT